jgi:DNA-directed RNA polymerase specialized sigma24 family protein
VDADEFDRVDDLDELRRRLPALSAALGCLTEASAEAVTLRVGHEWSYSRLAEHLECSPASARVRISRALHDLESHLNSHPAPGDTP